MLNKHNLSLAALCSLKENRFITNAILVEPDKTVVTDGRQLTMVTRPKFDVDSFPEVPGAPALAKNGDQPTFLMPADAACAIQKSLPKKSTIPILTNAAVCMLNTESKTVAVITTDLESAQTHMVRVSDGTFPDYNRVMPKPEKQCYSIRLDAALLNRVLSQFVAFNKDGSGKSNVEFRFHQHTEHKQLDGSIKLSANALRIDANGGDNQHMTAIVMPMSDIPDSLAPSIAPSVE